MDVQFFVNGEERTFGGDQRTPLLDVLRGDFRLTGTKSVCRGGFCGACTVLIDGEPVPSCQRPVGLLEGAEITTIEGMAPVGELNLVQQAFLDHDVVQCGMCFPGMVITLTHFLGSNPMPGRAEIKEALAGNMCRCTGYERIVDAVLSICPTEQAEDQPPVPEVSER
ncbi:carbon-monoxide dehydrogenase small subunit [Arboricoccus pini]|uniref:Carbon-monoxide dehydrogenase small subunit n=1 Tax=Arboricoccus pini TaxID=1963835 RepID=A0A212Q0M8_9PROT|nr:(2Fe-2S)-binding protein [Arboricoccus pini]SNB52856.1 carbon-monoxide dehydrogenase small subunit [Arboricoccus pini]